MLKYSYSQECLLENTKTDNHILPNGWTMLTSPTHKMEPKYPHIPLHYTFLKDHKTQLYYIGCLTQTNKNN